MTAPELRDRFLQLADRVVVPSAQAEVRSLRDRVSEWPPRGRYRLRVVPVLDGVPPVVMVELGDTTPRPGNRSPSGHLLFEADLEHGEVRVTEAYGESGTHTFELTNPDREETGRYAIGGLTEADVSRHVRDLADRVDPTQS
jgi:hypothetical protein